MFLPHVDACYDLHVLILYKYPGQNRIYLQYIYPKIPQISHTFFPKIMARNWGCGLSAGTFEKGVVNVDANVRLV